MIVVESSPAASLPATPELAVAPVAAISPGLLPAVQDGLLQATDAPSVGGPAMEEKEEEVTKEAPAEKPAEEPAEKPEEKPVEVEDVPDEDDEGFGDELADDDDLDEFDDIDEDDFDDGFDDDFEEELDDDYEIEIDDEISDEFGLSTGPPKESKDFELGDFDDFDNMFR